MSAAPPQGPTDPQVAQMLQAQVDMLCIFVPSANPELAFKALQTAAVQEQGLAQVWLEIAEGAKSHWQLRLSRQANDGAPIVLTAPKRLHGKLTGQDVLNWMIMVGALTSPFLRAALLLGGWAIEFAATDQPSRIIGPDGKLIT